MVRLVGVVWMVMVVWMVDVVRVVKVVGLGQGRALVLGLGEVVMIVVVGLGWSG